MKNIDYDNIVHSLEELEELYTRNMITYHQYMNIKTKLSEQTENKYKYYFHNKLYIVSMTNEERRRFERIYNTHLEPVEEDNE